ncbi:Adenylosuccinate lyase [Balamuthia mandrillaris]
MAAASSSSTTTTTIPTLSPLLAVSPLDGRYWDKVSSLGDYFSEYALIKYRIQVEVEYFIALVELRLPALRNFPFDQHTLPTTGSLLLDGSDLDSAPAASSPPPSEQEAAAAPPKRKGSSASLLLQKAQQEAFERLRDVYRHFTVEEAAKVKAIEKTTNHDMKAVEYYLKNKFTEFEAASSASSAQQQATSGADAEGGAQKECWTHYKEWIHFGLTSQDVTNTAVPLMLKEAVDKVYLPFLQRHIVRQLRDMAVRWIEVPMLARTHGQAATPTRLGREFMVFVERLQNQIKYLQEYSYKAKFGGATGGLNAHVVAFPAIDWIAFCNDFIQSLGLQRLQYTTQIDHYDNLGHLFDTMKRINTILIDFCRDVWSYVSLEYFGQKVVKTEVGSSTMPHKVNPIDFENSEGNLGIANALFEHLSAKLPVSRLQRDLSDSTVLRNAGVPIAHTILAFTSLTKGLSKLVINPEKIRSDLEANWLVVAEAIQTILRRAGYPNPYEALKEWTRDNINPEEGGKRKVITPEAMNQFIDSLDVSTTIKVELKSVTPFNYVGIIPPMFASEESEEEEKIRH